MSISSSSAPANSHESQPDEPSTDSAPSSPRRRRIRQSEVFGGVKVGSALFGFLTAIGVGVLLTALLAALANALGFAVTPQAADLERILTRSAYRAELLGGIILLAVLFIAYFCGGYVAGRMARFDGGKQGLAVWIWGVVIALVIAAIAAIAVFPGDTYDVLDPFNGFPHIPIPQIPFTDGRFTTGAVIAAIASFAVSLVGAIAGGLAGMRFHRRVDRMDDIS